MVNNKTLWLIGNDLVNELVDEAPVDTGRLKNSIKVEHVNNDKISISMVDYAAHVEFGTKPHDIVPKNKKALKFKGVGGTVFAKKVRHPGTRPNPFISNTIRNKLGDIIVKRLENERLTIK